MFFGLIPISLQNVFWALLKSIFLSGISIIYVRFYQYSRKMSLSKNIIPEISKTDLMLCLCVNFFLFCAAPFPARSIPENLLILLLCLTEDVDIFIQKIPTEFLPAEFLSVCFLYYPFDWISVLSGLAVNFLWFLFQKKTGMGRNDIYLIMILSICLRSLGRVLIFDSFILILWGLTGLILRFFFKKNVRTKMPLAPVIVSVFILMNPVF